MRRISGMYQKSKGMIPGRKCSECGNYFQDGKKRRCVEHSFDAPWKPDWMACKFFATEDNPKRKQIL